MLINIGSNCYVEHNKILCVVAYEPISSPISKKISEAKNKNLLIDFTRGKKTKTVIFLDNKIIILSAVLCDEVMKCLNWDNV